MSICINLSIVEYERINKITFMNYIFSINLSIVEYEPISNNIYSF